jgi:hypothetical protein
MMPTINLSDKTTQKLQMLAIPLKDSYDSVIARLAEAALEGIPYARPDGIPSNSASPIIRVVPVTPPAQAKSLPVVPASLPTHDSLTHTRLTYASFNGEVLANPKWNNLARLAHERAYQALGSFDALQRATTARIQKGKFEEQGYVYLHGIDISLQGMDANQSWNSVAELAQRIGVPVEAHFQWRNNPSAAHPGQGSTLCYQP